MIALLIQIGVLVRAVARSLREDQQFRALGLALGIALALGTLFYWRTEEWSLLDSLYFWVMTIATIGYGDLTPTHGLSKGFTIIYAVMGIGIFASFVGKLVALQLEVRAHRRQRRNPTDTQPPPK